jgi:hypothetical protein
MRTRLLIFGAATLLCLAAAAQAQTHGDLDRVLPILGGISRRGLAPQNPTPSQYFAPSLGRSEAPSVDPSFRARQQNGWTPGPTAAQREHHNRIMGQGGMYYDKNGLLRPEYRESVRQRFGNRKGSQFEDAFQTDCRNRGIDCDRLQRGTSNSR